MKSKLKWYKRSENPRFFWLQLAIICVIIWLVSGLISFISLPDSVMFVIKVIVGLAPCGLFLFAVLCWLETKGKRKELEKKFRRMEDGNFILFGILSLFAEIAFQFSEGISFALPFTFASLAGAWMIRLSVPKSKENEENKKKTHKKTDKNIFKSRFSNGSLILIMLLGCFICMIFANFIKSLSDILPLMFN